MSLKTERVEARFPPDIKRLAERAATVSGLSLTDYLTRLVIEYAPQTLQAHKTISLTNQQFDDFIAYCDNPPQPSERLRLAAKRLKEEGFGNVVAR